MEIQTGGTLSVNAVKILELVYVPNTFVSLWEYTNTNKWETINKIWVKGVTGLSTGKGLTIKATAMIDGDYAGYPHDQEEFTKADALNPVLGPIANYESVKFEAKTDEVSDVIDNQAAVDNGDGTVDIPIASHAFTDGQIIYINGTTNYDGQHTLAVGSVGQTYVIITATYAAETFAGTETISPTVLIKLQGLVREVS